MKIRIKGNSIRIRLSRTEVDTLGKEGYLEELTEFGGNVAFKYALHSKDYAATLSAGFEGNTMSMYMPAEMVAEWVSTEKVGYSHNMDIGDNKQLFLLLEKDFKCIDNSVEEDQSDNYDNPLHVC